MGQAIPFAFPTSLVTRIIIAVHFIELRNECALLLLLTLSLRLTPVASADRMRRTTRARAHTRLTPGLSCVAPSPVNTRSLGTGVKFWELKLTQSTHTATRGMSPASALVAGVKDAEGDLFTTRVLSAFRAISREFSGIDVCARFCSTTTRARSAASAARPRRTPY
jgi:hypothetical protein